jgi:hypothetical protein
MLPNEELRLVEFKRLLLVWHVARLRIQEMHSEFQQGNFVEDYASEKVDNIEMKLR